MRTVGIIAEYNPLHNGHLYHMERAKALSGAERCIVVMSGNFVQRGEPACADKFQRAEWAVRAGADLVLELPSVYALASAERFALGGVRTLAATGILTDLAFGCESQEMETLKTLSNILTDEPLRFQQLLSQNLRMGKSYPRARYDALSAYGASHEMLEAISKPNNILAIEYIRALHICAPSVRTIAVTRSANEYHDTELNGTLSSATAIRAALLEGNRSALEAMPLFVGGQLLYDEQYPVTEQDFGALLLYALRRMDAEALAELPDVREGFENVLLRAAKKACSLEELQAEIKSKRYTLARCKRIAMNALLGITEQQTLDTIRAENSTYLHVLACSASGKQLLSEIGKQGTAPLIMRQSDIARCPQIVQQNLAIDALSTDIYAIATGISVRRDYEGPVII